MEQRKSTPMTHLILVLAICLALVVGAAAFAIGIVLVPKYVEQHQQQTLSDKNYKETR